MNIKIFTCFPDFFSGVFCSLISRAISNKLIMIDIIDIKRYGTGKHSKVDDTPFGGGSGLILKPDVLFNAIQDNIKNLRPKIVITSPRGKLFNQNIAESFSKIEDLFIIANRYEGVDQRVLDFFQIEEISIGNFILMGGEIAATAIIESTVRLIPNVLGNPESILNETDLSKEHIQHDHFTKPAIWNGIEVPEVLKNGNHKEIKKWRELNSLQKLGKN